MTIGSPIFSKTSLELLAIFPLKLRKISLICTFGRSQLNEITFGHIREVFQSQADTLEEIVLKNVGISKVGGILKTILTKCKKLSILRTEMILLSNDCETCKSTGIKEIHSGGGFLSSETMKMILAKCPELEVLHAPNLNLLMGVNVSFI